MYCNTSKRTFLSFDSTQESIESLKSSLYMALPAVCCEPTSDALGLQNVLQFCLLSLPSESKCCFLSVNQGSKRRQLGARAFFS